MSDRVRPSADTWETPKTIWNPIFISVFFASIMLNLSQQLSNSMLSVYADSLGTPADQVGSLMSMFAITALIFRFVSGPAMNAFNRKKILMMALCFFIIAYLGFSTAPAIAAATGLPVIGILKAFRLLQGVGNAFGNSCLMVIVSDSIPTDRFSSGMGIYACAQIVAQAIGPTVGVMLRKAFGYNTAYLVCAGGMSCALLLTIFIVRVAPQKKVPFRLTPRTIVAVEALVPASIMFLVHMGFVNIGSFLILYSEKRGIAGGSFFFTVYALTCLVTRPIAGKLIDKYGFVRVGVPAIGFLAVSLYLIGIAPNTFVLLLAAFINAFGFGIAQPALQSLCMRSVPAERRGSASSTNYIAVDGATLVAPIVMGRVAKALGYVPTMWIVMTIPVLCGMILALILSKKIRHIEEAFAARSKAN